MSPHLVVVRIYTLKRAFPFKKKFMVYTSDHSHGW